MTNIDGLNCYEVAMQRPLQWVSYKGGTWTMASRLGTTRNMYNANKRHITKGQELSLRGKDLADYKACHLEAYGESLKCPTLLVVDRERAKACLSYMAGQSTTSPLSCTQSTSSSVVHGACATNDHSTAALTEVVAVTAISSMEGMVADKGVLEDLLKITQDKGLHWVEYGGGIYLPMVEACLAKGMERDDYSSNWQGQLPGVGLLLEGAALQAFKASYTREYQVWPYPRVRSLRIGNWEHAYAYLVQGKSTTATTFQTMGAKSIHKTIQQTTVALRCPESWSTEEEMVGRVFKLMELSPISMQREACFYNSLGNTPTTRRVDAIEHIPGEGGRPPKVHIYEFKKGHITSAHVMETVGTKGYIHLVRECYPEARVCLFMVGNQVDPQAQRLLDCMLGVMYLPLSTLLNKVLASIVSSWPKEGHYQLRTHFLSQYADILPQEMLSGPIQLPQIVTTYHRPLAPSI